jgi:hypothetical protein
MKTRRTRSDLKAAAKRHLGLRPNYDTMIATSDGMWFTSDQEEKAQQYAESNGLEQFTFTRDEIEGKSNKTTKK